MKKKCPLFLPNLASLSPFIHYFSRVYPGLGFSVEQLVVSCGAGLLNSLSFTRSWSFQMHYSLVVRYTTVRVTAYAAVSLHDLML